MKKLLIGLCVLGFSGSLCACTKEITGGISLGRTTPTTNPQPKSSTHTTQSIGASPVMASHSLWKLNVTNLPIVELQNTSEKRQTILPDSKVQPARLHLFDDDGEELTPFDERARMKFNNSLQKSSYVTVEPGESIAFSKVVVVEDGDYSLVIHGPFRFSVKSGASYTGCIEWRSERNDYLDNDGTLQKLSEAWLGAVISNNFTLHIQ